MNTENIPQSLQVALDVEESEYRKAKLQVAILWTGTMLAPLAGLALWALGIRLLGWMAQAVGVGVGAYALLYALLPEARKMSTTRMKKYKELRMYRAAGKKLETRQQRESNK